MERDEPRPIIEAPIGESDGRTGLADMPVVQTSFVRSDFSETPQWSSVETVRDQLLHTMNLPPCRARINEANVPGASSALVQEAILEEADFLGFTSERTGLFGHYQTPGLRPDYYLPLGDTGILFEVERGKTTINNMDLLDFWKCHLCDLADYLFLLVPQVLIQSEKRSPTRPYAYVVNRLHSFFTEYGERTQVRGACIFGY